MKQKTKNKKTGKNVFILGVSFDLHTFISLLDIRYFQNINIQRTVYIIIFYTLTGTLELFQFKMFQNKITMSNRF